MNVLAAAFMARAIRLAERGRLSCAPNPRVGCVLVREGRIVGQGWHVRAGGPHAEIVALQAAGAAALGATAYVSLEPCNHQGRTGPCAQALIAAGVQAVVYAATDDGGRSGGGGDALRAAGLQVEGGLLRAEAERLNPGFHRRQRGGLPWVRLKLAQSLDGCGALRNGRSQWITGAAARRDGHRWRARSCAMVTGIGTVLADDPQMTARLDGEACAQPLRVVLDSRGRTPARAKLRADGHFLLVHGPSVPPADHSVSLPLNEGRIDLREMLHLLSRRGCNEILVEAGAELSAAFLRAKLVDELIIYQAPSLLGDGRPAVDLGMLEELSAGIRLELIESRRLGADSRIIARLAHLSS